MKKLLLFVFFACFAATTRAEEHPACDKATLRSVDRTLDFAIGQSLRLYESVKETPDQMPRSWYAATDSLITCPIRWWASGFFPGTMWYLYEYSGREDLRRIAEQLTERMDSEKDRTDNHDIGFAINCTYGNGYRLTHKEAYRDVIVTAARNFATRFDPKVGCTRSWNTKKWGYTVIIDNMMNLELLTVASHLAGDNS
ncbi:MAG: glycosyl hydrolase family 88, partial [Alistipes sp.]|nr:glycosyl hydrolase family 88 [Alistipes sp.]